MLKSRFPGKPLGRSHSARIRISTGKVLKRRPSKNEAGTSGMHEADNIRRGFLNFVDFCGLSDSDETEERFHGFTEDDIARTESLVTTRRALIQNSLCLRDDQKFAAIDPKLLALHPPPLKCAPSLPQQQQQDVLQAHVEAPELKVTPKIKSKGRRKTQGDASVSSPKFSCRQNCSKINVESGVTASPQNEIKSKRKIVAKSTIFEKLNSVESPSKPVDPEPKPVNPMRPVNSERPKRRGKHKVEPKTEVQSPEPAKLVIFERKSLSRKEVAKMLDAPSPIKTSSEVVSQSPKLLLRPSVLGDLGSSGQAIKEGSFSAGASSLIVEGKRQWKPSLKILQQQEQEGGQKSTSLFGKSEFELPSPLIKQSITQYADAVTHSKKTDKTADDSVKMNEKIERMLASQWDSRLRKVENKFVKTGSRTESPEVPQDQTDMPVDKPSIKPVLLRESKLVLNEGLLERLRNPSQQKEFYQQIQESMQSADKNPPKLVQGVLDKKGSINPVGTALVEPMPFSHVPASQLSEETSMAVSSAKSNRRPGNIICGICGALRYYAFINQAKKFGTYSCEPCRKFISKKMQEADNQADIIYSCISATGMCVVPPVIRTNANVAKRKSDNDVRCEACWLKLCLIGYNLETDLYDKLRSCLPIKIFGSLLPEGAQRNKSPTLVPHRGEILEINRQVPLSRPLFDGFGSQGKEQQEVVKAKIVYGK